MTKTITAYWFRHNKENAFVADLTFHSYTSTKIFSKNYFRDCKAAKTIQKRWERRASLKVLEEVLSSSVDTDIEKTKNEPVRKVTYINNDDASRDGRNHESTGNLVLRFTGRGGTLCDKSKTS